MKRISLRDYLVDIQKKSQELPKAVKDQITVKLKEAALQGIFVLPHRDMIHDGKDWGLQIQMWLRFEELTYETLWDLSLAGEEGPYHRALQITWPQIDIL